MTWTLRRLSLTSKSSTKSLSISTRDTATPTTSPLGSPLESSPPSPLVFPPPQIKRTDNRFRRLSTILSRPLSKRGSGESSEPPKIVPVVPKVDEAAQAPAPCFVEAEETSYTNGYRPVRRFSRVEQVDPTLFVIEEQQHATDKMVQAQRALGTTSEEMDTETEDDSDGSLSTSSELVKSTLSLVSLEEPHIFEALYELHEAVGSGNFSTVYAATRKSDGASFAVKKINKSVLAYKEDLIRAEIDIHSALNHNNIIKVIEVFETAEEWNIVLQLAPGGELFAHLVKNGAMGERRGKDMARSILKAVSFFHKKQVVHRDLKPENILLHANDSNEVYIADFGLSTLMTPGEPLTKQCGSLEYAAPEILSGKAYDQKVDMWSLGVIIYTLIAGYQPFQGSSDSRVARAICAGRFEFHDSHWCYVSDEAKDLVSKLLKVDPTERLSAQEALKHPWFN